MSNDDKFYCVEKIPQMFRYRNENCRKGEEEQTATCGGGDCLGILGNQLGSRLDRLARTV